MAAVALREREGSGAFVRLAIAGAVGFTVLLPAVELGRIAVDGATTVGLPVGPLVPALVATAAFLPLHLWHVVHALRGSRPPGAGWTLAAMALVIVAATPLVGPRWLYMFASLALSVLIVVRPPWSFIGCLGLAVVMAPLALALGEPGWSAIYFPVTVAWRGVTLFVFVWLVAAARQLQAARLALTDEVVLRERLRIEGELRATVGEALATIAKQGEWASEMAGRDPAAARDELRVLVEGSRRTLAEARRISGSFQRVSLRAELDTAATLLKAAGVETHLMLPPGDRFEVVDERMRSTLRSAAARLLADGTARRCTIAVSREGGRLRLEVRSEGRQRETVEVTA
jgi:two-component system, NarL family, sensor histidine kinase DesK